MKLFHSEKTQRGSATVEACLSFTGFIFVIFTILGVVNVCRAQMLISNAVDTAVKELSQYSYFYEMSGLQKINKAVGEAGNAGTETINTVLDSVNSLYTGIGDAAGHSVEHSTNISNAINEGSFDIESIQNMLKDINSDSENISQSIDSVTATVGDIMENPMVYLKSIVAIAGSTGLETVKSHYIAAPLARAFTLKHFGSSKDEASTFLKKLGVVKGVDGLNFNMSTIFTYDNPGDIHIVCYYTVKLDTIFEWADLEVNLCKEAVAHAWLGGDKSGVDKEKGTESESEGNDVDGEQKAPK